MRDYEAVFNPSNCPPPCLGLPPCQVAMSGNIKESFSYSNICRRCRALENGKPSHIFVVASMSSAFIYSFISSSLFSLSKCASRFSRVTIAMLVRFHLTRFLPPCAECRHEWRSCLFLGAVMLTSFLIMHVTWNHAESYVSAKASAVMYAGCTMAPRC